MTELYKLLNVPRTATLIEIKAAYRVLALELHPDVNKGSAGKTARFRDIVSAYEILSDVASRNRYDRTLGSDVRKPTTTNRKYEPPRSPFVYAPPSSSSTAADRAAASAAADKYRRDFEASGGRIKFNVEEWHAWHYGDQAIIDALKMRSLRMGLGDNKDYINQTKRQQREEDLRRKKAFSEAEEQAAAVLQQMKEARENLKKRRENRRKLQKDEDSGGLCSMS